MKVKISEKIVCIPPYISTTWDQIAFLQSERDIEGSSRLTLILQLTDGQTVKIPDLDSSLVEIVFSAHIQFLEKNQLKKEEAGAKNGGFQFFPSPFSVLPEQMAAFQIRLGNGMDGIENAFQHNPQQANSPPLPKEIIDKIAGIAKILTSGDTTGFPKPEPHCNCVHCQVARSMHNIVEDEEKEEEVVKEEDLKFRTWDILQTSDNLYMVTNPIDPKEHYNVYLGTPVGCTCGHPHCEHIRAVLIS